MRVAMLMLLSLLLAGCTGDGFKGSIAGGECRIFERPPYEVRGQRSYDQDWIDSQVEGGVGGCHWKRPGPRPASLDAAPGHKPVAAAPVKRKSLVRRIRDRVLPAKVDAPAAPTPVETPVVVAPPPPPPPRSAIEKLLQPRDDD